MSVNDEKNRKPAFELGLALGYSNQCMKRRLMSNGSGAGANAGSGINMTFVTNHNNNHLSELVWSPRKGPSNVALLPAHRVSADNRLVDEEDFLAPIQMKGCDVEGAGKDGALAGSRGPNRGEDEKGGNEKMGGLKNLFMAGTSDDVSVSHMKNPNEELGDAKTGQGNKKTADISSTKLDQTNKPDEIQVEAMSESPVDEDKNADRNDQTAQMDFVLTSEAHRASEKKARSSVVASRIFQARKRAEKMESTSENNLHNLKNEREKAVDLELPREVKGGSEKVKEAVEEKRSPRVNRRKGKEKALSDGDLNRMMSKDEDDESHESVESCNSAGLFAMKTTTTTGKRRRSFEEGLVSGSKGIKKQMQCAQSSMPVVAKQDSSFMNWISNVMKGFSQTAQEDDNPVPLRVARPIVDIENPDRRLVSFNKNPEPPGSGSKIIGFQSIFQSLYCSKAEAQETRVLKLDPANKTSDYNSDHDGKSEKQVLALNDDKVSESPSRNEENSEGNIDKKLLLESSSKGKEERTSFGSSLGKRKMKSDDNERAESAGKTTSRLYHRNDNLGSFWITRFSAKTPSSSSNPDHHLNLAVGLSLMPPAEDHSSEALVCGPGKEPKSTGVRIKSPDESTSLNKLNPILPFTAPIFARQLDTFKHVTWSRVSSDATCFFCGTKGHKLRDCSEIAETELDELLKNLDTCSGSEESSCLCIRCFQQNHWAIACPKASSAKHLQVESSFKEMHIGSGNNNQNKENPKLGTDNEGKFQSVASLTFCEGDKLRMRTDFDWKADEVVPLEENKCHVASGFVENQIAPFSLFVAEQNIADAPKGLFNLVRRLRLSRSDIIKWMNSLASISQIEGLFLRLRLGKWEEGLGGTGYHVACVIGTQRDDKQKGAKSSLLVNVGGMKCLIESRYISNNDFLEDELMAWWSISTRNGDKIPSEEDLRVKVKTKTISELF